MKGTSQTPQEKILEELRELMPEAFTEGKIDWEKLKATLGNDISFSNERYVLNWAGKSDAFRALQTPTSSTLIPDKKQSVNFDNTKNVFIEGENLEVLKVLQKSYFGKVKMIYIDPPYNTGNDSFIYPDKFAESKEDYQKRIGDKDEEGMMTNEGFFRKNSKENGQYHSNWLNMIYPRLFLAKNLLKHDGVIFISINDVEYQNLKCLANEIFGEDNFITTLIWKSRQIVDSRAQNGVSNDHEYILVYGKSGESRLIGKPIDKSKYSNPDNDPRGPWMSNSILGLATKDQRPNLHYKITDPETGIEYDCPAASGWRYSPDTMSKKIEEKRIVFPSKPTGRPREKKFLNELTDEFTNTSSVLPLEVGYTLNGSREVREILEGNYFQFPKPTSLISFLVDQVAVEEDDIVLDFFAGSATTGHAVFNQSLVDKTNRRFVCIQFPEPCDEKSEAKKAGFDSISSIAIERLRRVAQQKRTEIDEKLNLDSTDYDTGFQVYKLAPSNFLQWRDLEVDNESDLINQMELFIEPYDKNATIENMVYELILKSGKDLVGNLQFEDGTVTFEGNEIVFFLKDFKESKLTDAIAMNPKKIIALDTVFEGNDQMKTNTALQLKDAGIEFKTI